MDRLEAAALAAIVASVLAGTVLARTDPSAFEAYVTEDGVIEWLTVVSLLAGACVCAARLGRWRRALGWRRLAGTLLLLMLLVFGAGEELSWGQRILGTEGPEFFREHNAQRETNFHNLVVFGVKVNKLVFSKVLGVFNVFYWFVLPVLYPRRRRVREFVDRWAIPVVRVPHVVAFALSLLLVQLTPNHRKWELLEWAGVAILFFVVMRPRNPLMEPCPD